MGYHSSVLLKESVDALEVKKDGVYVDVTYGGGGHSKEILSRLGDDGRLFAFDQDKDACKNKIDDDRLVLIQENFRYVSRFLKFHGVRKVDGVLADLGVSSYQFDEVSRGFSIRFDAGLDMRMNQGLSFSAEDVVNDYEEQRLANVFYQYGDLKNSRVLAKAIVLARVEGRISTTFQLKAVLSKYVPKLKENRFLAQVFQALRIEVNQELEVLKEFLKQMPELLADQGRLSVISYHSLEDRLVKRFIQSGNFNGVLQKDFFGNVQKPMRSVGKLMVPSSLEVGVNNRSRSAKLRVATLDV